MIIGEKIKKLRSINNISLEKLAQTSGLSIQQLTELENGTHAANLATLINVAKGLGVRTGTLLDDDTSTNPVICRFSDRLKTTRYSDQNAVEHFDFYGLATHKADRHMEPFIVKISDVPEKTPSAHEGEEFIYVLEGTLNVSYGKENFVLEKGDSIYYDSIVPHALFAKNTTAKILAVIYTPC